MNELNTKQLTCVRSSESSPSSTEASLYTTTKSLVYNVTKRAWDACWLKISGGTVERRWTGEKGKAANGTDYRWWIALTLLEGSLVRRNTNIIWSTTISSSLVQKRTEQFREIDNLHLRNDAWTAQFIRSWSASGSTKNNWNTKYWY